MKGSREATAAAVPIDVWEGQGAEVLRQRFGAPRVLLFAEVGSTNDVVRELAEAGAPHGTTVIAEHQRAGRGRMGRAWSDRPGGALLVSVLLRPVAAYADAAGAAPVLPLRVGLACARAIRDCTGLRPGIEWPNDIVLDDRKLGGILCEGSSRGGALEYVVAGIGINVSGAPEDLEPAVAARATSIASVMDGVPDRAALATAILRTVAHLRPDEPLHADELTELRALDSLSGRYVRLGTGREARALRILQDGGLELEDATGRFSVHAGSATPVPEHP